jgi:hypothetical protein
MSSLEKRICTFMAGYDLAVKEILSSEVLPPEIVTKLKQWLVLK